MRFLKLLDHRDVDFRVPGRTVADQVRRALETFPTLVADSSLRYWRPGDSFVQHGLRCLIGLAVSYSPDDLRIADILNEAILTGRAPSDVQFDVFAIEDVPDPKGLSRYLGTDVRPTLSWRSHPIVGVWKDGQFQYCLVAGKAIDYLFELLGVPMNATELFRSVRPPDPVLLEDIE